MEEEMKDEFEFDLKGKCIPAFRKQELMMSIDDAIGAAEVHLTLLENAESIDRTVGITEEKEEDYESERISMKTKLDGLKKLREKIESTEVCADEVE